MNKKILRTLTALCAADQNQSQRDCRWYSRCIIWSRSVILLIQFIARQKQEVTRFIRVWPFASSGH